jgi:hypothetical protein
MGEEYRKGIYGPVVAKGIWIVRTNREFEELYRDLDIVADSKNKRLERMGHMISKTTVGE